MDWPLIRDTLAAVVPQVCNIPVLGVVWKGSLEEQSMVVGTRCVLSTNSITMNGIDESRLADVLNENQNVNICGNREFTWTIQIECQNQGPVSTARVLVDQIIVRMNRESVRGMLNAAGLAKGEVLTTTQRDFLTNGRMVSWAMVDFKMLSIENDQDTDETAGEWIGDALIDGTVTSDGVDIDISLDVNTLT